MIKKFVGAEALNKMFEELIGEHPKVLTHALLIGQGLVEKPKYQEDEYRHLRTDFANIKKVLEHEQKDILNS